MSMGQNNYAKYATVDNLDKKQTIKSEYGLEQITYLGTVHSADEKVYYHVFTVFLSVNAAIVKHGHSSIVFLDQNLKLIRKYELSLPEDLPFKLKNNTLFFYYFDDLSKQRRVFKTLIEAELPKVICISPIDCY